MYWESDVNREQFRETSKQQRTERLAYNLWIRRGRPMGDPETDWNNAKEMITDRDKGIGYSQVAKDVIGMRFKEAKMMAEDLGVWLYLIRKDGEHPRLTLQVKHGVLVETRGDFIVSSYDTDEGQSPSWDDEFWGL